MTRAFAALISGKMFTPEPEKPVETAAPSSPQITFRGNLKDTRYGWLRLTPAYSLHLVKDLLSSRARPDLPVLDPFCGTGTTLLACAEQGIACTTVDINPFLIWLARAKSARYSAQAVNGSETLIRAMCQKAVRASKRTHWQPNLHQIEKWWDEATLRALSAAYAHVLQEKPLSKAALDLARLAFCRTLIDTAHVSFGHQSMSFRKREAERAGALQVSHSLRSSFASIARAALLHLPRAERKLVHGDARTLNVLLAGKKFGSVITSPPYANRMSYVRELRPYMYWLGYFNEGRDAGELDWKAIGGTWGTATSRLNSWQPDENPKISGFSRTVSVISQQSPVLGRYVHKYFCDMTRHVRGLSEIVAEGGEVSYVVGNSKFYDTLLPAQDYFAELFEANGFKNATVKTIRKRTSKRELYEYVVCAQKPASRRR